MKKKALKTARITVSGIVQGVGFRPFIHRLARRYGVAGRVINRSGTVLIEATAGKQPILDLCAAIRREKPAAAQISGISVKYVKLRHYNGFSIGRSGKTSETKLIPPDLALCPDCFREFSDRADRRYLYPFINCTNCGPRFTIIEDTPYDRANTSMKKFKMCPDCLGEYNDINDRRYHAEPNACPVCGPKAWLADHTGRRLKVKDVFGKCREALKRGRIVAVKGIGGFHLAVNASGNKAVERLKLRKKRSNKPLAVMSDTPGKIRSFAVLTPDNLKLLRSAAAPILLLPLKKNRVIAPGVAEGLKHIGVFMPYTPLHHLLFDGELRALVMTSANLAEEPIQHENKTAVTALRDIADYFLFHDRDIIIPADDSVIKPAEEAGVILRRSRGYVPAPVALRHKGPDVIGAGALLRNSACFLKGDKAFMSQHIGDLENARAAEYFSATINRFVKFFGITPEAIACDKHPDYISTGFAEEFSQNNDIPLFKVQHHYSHMLSVMAERRFEGRAAGIILDGTGLGDDGNVWGGEFLTGSLKGFERRGHFKYRKLPGGDLASKETDRMALSLLYGKVDEKELGRAFGAKRVEEITSAIKTTLNTPLSSSAGRLFDAAAAITGVCGLSTYDAEAPMKLEAAAYGMTGGRKYRFKIGKNNGCYEVDMGPAFLDLWKDKGSPKAALNFHYTMADALCETAGLISEEASIKDVILSGGVFQNTVLLGLVLRGLKKRGFNVLMHETLPPNDGSIALGQAWYAANNLRS